MPKTLEEIFDICASVMFNEEWQKLVGQGITVVEFVMGYRTAEARALELEKALRTILDRSNNPGKVMPEDAIFCFRVAENALIPKEPHHEITN